MGTNQDILGYNLFAYCSNNPIAFIDSDGHGKISNFFKKVSNSVKKFVEKTFGASVSRQHSYKELSAENLFFGIESGTSLSKSIKGQSDKAIQAHFQQSSQPQCIWENQVGVKVNTKNGGLKVTTSGGSLNIEASYKNNAIELQYNVSKIGITYSNEADWKNYSFGSFTHVYIRPIPLAMAGAILYMGGYNSIGAVITETIIPIFSRR